MNSSKLAELDELYRRLEAPVRAILVRCLREGRAMRFEELATYERLIRALDLVEAQERALHPRCRSCGQIKAK